MCRPPGTLWRGKFEKAVFNTVQNRYHTLLLLSFLGSLLYFTHYLASPWTYI